MLERMTDTSARVILLLGAKAWVEPVPERTPAR